MEDGKPGKRLARVTSVFGRIMGRGPSQENAGQFLRDCGAGVCHLAASLLAPGHV